MKSEKLPVKWHSIIILKSVVVNKNNKVLFLAAKLFRDFYLSGCVTQ